MASQGSPGVQWQGTHIVVQALLTILSLVIDML